MKSIKLLLLSSTIPLISAMLIQPVTAKPTLTIQQIKVSNVQITSINKALHFDIYLTDLPRNPANKNVNRYMHNVNDNLSNRLVLSSIKKTTEQQPTAPFNKLNNNNGFYEKTMMFNDKMQQIISYLSNRHNNL